MSAAGAVRPLPPAVVRRAVRSVLRREGAGRARISVTQLSSQRMRALNRRAFGRDRATDVIAFGMRHGPDRVGDVYICPALGARAAAQRGIPEREELVRLVVHGTLHALGHRHPDGPGRERSRMWRRQEGIVRAILRGGRA